MAAETSRGRNTRLGSLSTGDVAAAALTLAAHGGIEAVSIRGVAQQLGIATMSVYRFVQSKDELIDAVVLAVMDRMEIPYNSTDEWRSQIVATMLAWRELLLSHPVVIEILVARPIPAQSAGLARLTENVLASLEHGGIRDAAAVRAFWQIFSHTFGHVVFETPRRSLTIESQHRAGQRMRETARSRGFRRTADLASALTELEARDPLESSLTHLLIGLTQA